MGKREQEMRYVLGKVISKSSLAVRIYVQEYEDTYGKVADGRNEELWFPHSQIEVIDLDWDDLSNGDEIELEVPPWLMGEKGLI